jgi:HSP20 family molecular chaperone IbpA
LTGFRAPKAPAASARRSRDGDEANVRYRRISYRYTEVVGGLSGAIEAELWSSLRPQALASPLFRPPADVVETPASYVVTIELPGVADEDVDIFVHPDALVVTGRRRPCELEGAHYLAAEIRHGPFRFDMAMPPDADAERVEASSERGLLRVVLARRAGGFA